MYDILGKLGTALFEWQKQPERDPELSGRLDALLEQLLERRLGLILRESLSTHQATAILSKLETEFRYYRGSIHPGDVGRFCHAVLHRQLSKGDPDHTWRLACAPPADRNDPDDERLLLSLKLAEALDARRPHALPFPVPIWLSTLIGLLLGLLLGWMIFGGSLKLDSSLPTQTDTATIEQED